MADIKRQHDPMFNLFIEEMDGLLESLKEQLDIADNTGVYDSECINEIFRIVHTIKADATMMLIESIAEPARAVEKLLYFYREHSGEGVKDKEFNMLMMQLLNHYYVEIERLDASEISGSDGTAFANSCYEYYNRIAFAEEKTENFENTPKEAGEEDNEEEPLRFYIASRTVSDDTEVKKAELQNAVAAGFEFSKRTGVANLTVSDVNEYIDIMEKADKLKKTFVKKYSEEQPDMVQEFESISKDMYALLKKVYMSELTGISMKIGKVVSEMNRRLGKEVRVIIEGDDNLIERPNLEKLSGSIIHLIRNSIDHGIEPEGIRERLNKKPGGSIHISYSVCTEPFGLNIRYSDDGCGLNPDEILITALDKGIISADDIINDESDIYNMIMLPGYTTSRTAGEYSGRGVGMDAVKHNIQEMNGTINIFSVIDEGTTFEIFIPYMVVSLKLVKGDAE